MSAGFFYSNPTPQDQAPINNVFNMNGDQQQNFNGSNGGYANYGNGHSNNMMQQQQFNQQQLNPQQIQQLINQQQQQQQQMNQQQLQFQQGAQTIHRQQQFDQHQINHHQQQHQFQQNQHQNQYSYQQQQFSNSQPGNQVQQLLSRNDINSIKALIGGQQPQVPNNMTQVPMNYTVSNLNGVNAAAAQSSFFGNLFNQLNFFANNTDTNSQSMSIQNNNPNMNSGGGFNSNNLMVPNPLQMSTTPMSESASFHHQQQQMNFMNPQSATPTASTIDVTQLNQSGASPTPMAFLTPRMSLTPNPPTNPPTPMMTPRMGMTPDPMANDTPAPPLGSLNEMNATTQQETQAGSSWSSSLANAPSFSIGTKGTATSSDKSKKSSTKGATASAIANAQKSFFRRGLTSVGSALTVVANYIHESLLSGIPFHIADRAMRESKETYAKWWEGGINDEDTDEEENPDGNSAADDSTLVAGNGDHVEKKRKLASGEGVDSTENRGSALSASLEKNYNAVGIDTKRQLVRHVNDRHEHNHMPASSMPHSKPMEVDSSIIKRRRSQFDHAHKKEDARGLEGYDIFNNIGCMYGNNVSSMNKDPVKVSSNSFDGNNTSAMFVEDTTTTATTIKSNSAIDGTMNAIKELFEEKNNVQDEKDIYHMISSPRQWVTRTLRSELIDALQSSQGDTKDKRFLSSLEILSRFYKSTGRDARANPWCTRKVSDESNGYGYNGGETGGPLASDLLEGSWVNMSRPNYVECLGKNKENEFMYTLGRMSFDMFQPGDLICSVQSTHNNIRIVGEQEELPAFVPKSLKEEVASLSNSNGDSTSKRPLLRSYDIAVSMTLEPPASVGQPEPTGTPFPTKRLRAIIAVKGYVLPDPQIPNRLTVWFTGGKLCPAKLSNDDEEDEDFDEEGGNGKPKGKSKKKTAKKKTDDDEEYGGFDEWTALFSKGKWRKTLGERARAMAAKLLLGADIPNKMEEDGHMEYSLHRPVGGHSKVYVEVMYLDEDILIMRGHRGTIYAMARSCVSQRYSNMNRDGDKS